MKNWAFLLFCFVGFFIFAIEDAQAAEWQEGEVITGSLKENTSGPYSITLEKDARVTFTLTDVADDYKVVVSDSKNKPVASITTNKNDDDEEKTVQSVNLKKGKYKVSVSKDWIITQCEYEVTYQTSQIEGTDVEPNNTQLEANPYTLGATYRGELHSRGFTNYDVDIYKVEVPTFGKLTLQMQITEGMPKPSFGFALEAVNEKNEEMFKLESNDEPSEIEVLLQPGIHYFKIENSPTSEPITDYTFSTSFESLDENDWESGRNINIQSADVLLNNKTYKGFVYGGNYSYSQIDDYYKFTLEKDAKVTFIANAQKSLGALLFLDETGMQLRSGGYVTSDTRQIITTKNLKAGTYYVEYRTRYGLDGYEAYDLTMRIERFSDVPATHMYYEQIETLSQLGINKGYQDGTFHPNEAIKRKHVFALLNRIDDLKLPKNRPMKTFNDLKTSHPYYAEIKNFYEAGIIDGSGSNMNPESNLTRAQLAKILVNTFHLQMDGQERTFTDVKNSDGFYRYIQILASHGITTGSNGRFMPNEPVTREHFSVFLQRTLKAIQ